jgi:hypothetical protein
VSNLKAKSATLPLGEPKPNPPSRCLSAEGRRRPRILIKEAKIMTHRCWLFVFALVSMTAPAIRAQNPPLTSAQVEPFLGTWTFAMTNPPNSQQTVRIAETNGAIVASLQVGKFPPNDITGILKDGDVLVLTTTVRENGVPIWAVIALTRDGESMNIAQMLQNSQTIKRRTAAKRSD